jgi:hypothetical protein
MLVKCLRYVCLLRDRGAAGYLVDLMQSTGPDGKVCYYYNGDPRTIYERLVSSQASAHGFHWGNCIAGATALSRS